MSRQPSFHDLKEISAYLDGELSASATRRMKSRLARDPNLLAALDDLRQTRAILRQTPQRRSPRNFTLSPRMVAKRPPIPRLVPVLNYATVIAAFLFFFSFLSPIGFGAMGAPAPMMEAVEMAAPAEFNADTMDEDAMPAAEEMLPMAEAPLAPPAPAMEQAPIEEPAAEETAPEPAAGATASDRALATEMVESEPTEGENLAAEKALIPTLIPTASPTSFPTPLPVPDIETQIETAPLLTGWQRTLLTVIVLFSLTAFALRRKAISKWQKTSR
ncbi:MAG: hypothetical protein HQ525_03265 [Anaerolineae bacterium]|nr:hypothetical protein [Anaerolineae bacterium]